MTTENKKRFTVISNTNYEHNENYERNEVEKHHNYQTNPLQEKLIKFTAKDKFSVNDWIKW